MNQNIEYEYHRYVCPPKNGITKYLFKYLNPLNGKNGCSFDCSGV